MDFVCFSVNNWEKRRARKQQFMWHLSLRDDVQGVLYIEPALNFWRLIFMPLAGFATDEIRRRWMRALSFREEDVSDKFFIFTPIFFIPFAFRVQWIYNLNRRLSLWFVRRRLKKLKFKNMVLWFYHPFDYMLLGWFKERAVSCFDWAEKWSEYFTEYASRRQDFVARLEEKVVRDVDLVFVVSKALLEKARDLNRSAHQLLDGTVPEIFAQTFSSPPDDMKDIRRPVAGYIGTIADRFDLGAVSYLCDNMPDISFVFVGDVHRARIDISCLQARPNVFFLGGKRYDELPRYLAFFDVCLLPYKDFAATPMPPPTKVFDYLASGKPIVASRLAEIAFLKDVVYLAETPQEFERYTREALGGYAAGRNEARRLKAAENSWATRAGEIVEKIRERARL